MNKYLLIGLAVLVIILIGAIFFISSMENSNTNILKVAPFSDLTSEQFNQALNMGKFLLIDVRTVEEYSAGHIAKAEEADYYQTEKFSKFLDSLNKNANYLIYCRTGIRSGKAMQIMKDKGFTTVYDLAGGYNAWVSSGRPVK